MNKTNIFIENPERLIQTQCPRCGEWVEDLDGFGVLCHPTCGYCCHPSVNDDICGLCGTTVK